MIIEIIKKQPALTATICLMVAALILFKVLNSNPDQAAHVDIIASNENLKTVLEKTKESQPGDESSDKMQAFVNDMVSKLRDMHTHNIHEVKVQLSLRDLRNFIVETYVDKGENLFASIIRQAFPELADKILALVSNMDNYQEWLEDNQLALNDLLQMEREGRIWSKRSEIFGELTHEIWSQEVNEAEQKKQTVMNTVAMLDQADEITMDERLFLLQSAVQEQYDGNVASFLIDKGMISGIYFNLASVQKNLHALSEEDRQAQIDSSRRQLGFTEKDIAYMAAQDAKKEERWKNGYSYMAKRDELGTTLQGEELTKAMAELREEFFKHEAPTITKEEEQGFYRYERPRLYGQN